MRPFLGAITTGALPPDIETGLQSTLVAVDDLIDLSYNDMRTLADQGVDTSEHSAAAEAIGMEKSLLWTQIAQIDQSQVGDLNIQIHDLHKRASDLNESLVLLRRGAPEQQQIKGLTWGLGAVAVAGVVAWFVWDQRKKRRSR